jgi:hypothetical protein
MRSNSKSKSKSSFNEQRNSLIRQNNRKKLNELYEQTTLRTAKNFERMQNLEHKFIEPGQESNKYTHNTKNNLSRQFSNQYQISNKSFERIIFTDPNIPTIMKPVSGKPVKGGDIDDLFMILDAVLNCSNTLIVIGGEKGSSINRYNSFIFALNNHKSLKYLKTAASINNNHFISVNRFIELYKDKSKQLSNSTNNFITDCFIFCPINESILDFATECVNKGRKVFMQGNTPYDFNVKMSHKSDVSRDDEDQNIRERVISSFSPTGFTHINSLISGTPIKISDISDQFINIAKQTALAKVVGLSGIKNNLHNFFICNGDNNKQTHKANSYISGLSLQDKITQLVTNSDISLNETQTKGNTSIPILNHIETANTPITEEYKKLIYATLALELKVGTSFGGKSNSSDKKIELEVKIKTLLSAVFPEKNITNINKLLNTPQINNNPLSSESKIIIIIILGYIYKICGENFNEIFKDDGTIKDFNEIDVEYLTRNDTNGSKEIDKIFINLQLWDYVGFLAFKNQLTNKSVEDDVHKYFAGNNTTYLSQSVHAKLIDLLNIYKDENENVYNSNPFSKPTLNRFRNWFKSKKGGKLRRKHTKRKRRHNT